MTVNSSDKRKEDRKHSTYWTDAELASYSSVSLFLLSTLVLEKSNENNNQNLETFVQRINAKINQVTGIRGWCCVIGKKPPPQTFKELGFLVFWKSNYNKSDIYFATMWKPPKEFGQTCHHSLVVQEAKKNPCFVNKLSYLIYSSSCSILCRSCCRCSPRSTFLVSKSFFFCFN